jgi:WD40 repeat protein
VVTIGWHDGEVLGVAVVPDAAAGAAQAPAPAERRVLSWSADGTLRLWDTESGRLEATMAGHEGAVSACALALGGRYAVSGSHDRTLRIWEIATGRSLAVLEGHTAPVTDVFVTHDQRHVVSCSLDHSVRIWSVWGDAMDPNPDEALRPSGPQPVATLQDRKLGIGGGRSSRDGRLLATWSYDGEVRVWDLAGLAKGEYPTEPLALLRGHDGAVLDAAFGEPGQLVTASADRTLRIWDLASGQARVVLEGHTGAVRCCISMSGREGYLFYSGSDDRTMRQWDASGRDVAVLDGSARAVNACLVRVDDASSRIVVLGNQVRAAAAGAAETTEWITSGNPVDPVLGIAQSPDGRFLVSWSRHPGLSVWGAAGSRETGILSQLQPTVPPDAPLPRVVACTMTPDSRSAIVAYTDGALRVWNLAEQHLVHTLPGHEGRVSCVAVAPDAGHAISGSWDGTVRVWELRSGALLAALEGHTDRVLACAAHPHLPVAASASADGTLRLWDLESHRQFAVLSGHAEEVTHCAFTRVGDLVSAARDGTVRVWDGRDGAERLVLAGHAGWITGIAVDEERGILYSCSLDATVRAWHLGSGTRVGVFYGESPFRCIAALPDGLLAGDGAGNLWEVEVDAAAIHAMPSQSAASRPERFPLDFRPAESYREGARRFGATRLGGRRKHAGADLYAPVGSPVYALDDGEVILGPHHFYATTYALEVRHPHYIARYGEIHPNVPAGARMGARVRRGQLLGHVGQAQVPAPVASMLHLELYSGEASGPLTVHDNPPFNRRSDLIDPTPVLDRAILP